ncbi:hypothetical protein C5B90_19320 [Haloferax sp. Atlit-12N]|uniref:hypothetical protein n=1 Tax=unclassified Haloferax TaxID=2625095 RepID=UPI000E24F3EA|nr:MULTISPECIES: hypothetical protein [unclassified Haloferax]RDZ61423.1 hypothetical protein C5B90_19320 [Haloferax sp. Atlit-12N]REA00235.1 hypothetical protein DEQ92_20505 [Haloferax sp. Atlit-6N]
MTGRTSLTVDDDVGERFRSFWDEDNETVTEFVDRVCDVLERVDADGLPDDTEFNSNSDETDALPDNLLTTDHIDDIANAASTQTTRDIESLLRR